MDNKTHIAQGRSAAMENYVDFSGEKNPIHYTGLISPKSQLSQKDKAKYLAIGVGSLIVLYLVYTKLLK